MRVFLADLRGLVERAPIDEESVIERIEDLVETCGGGSLALEARDEPGDTALHMVCLTGLDRAAARLLDLGASPNVRNGMGHTPLWEAISAHAPECARLLLSRGAAITSEYDGAGALSAIHWAALWNATGIFKDLVRHGANVNSRDDKGRTPLHCVVASAVMSGEADIAAANELLRLGADPDLPDNEGARPRDCAHGALRGLLESIEAERQMQKAVFRAKDQERTAGVGL